MGKTVPSFRMALEWEISSWKDFREALKSAEEKAAFDEMMDMCRGNGMAAGAACNPTVFEPMIMSTLLMHEKIIRKIELDIAACRNFGLKQVKNSRGFF